MTSLATVGHSNHSFDKFLAILRVHGVEQVLDVRRFPTSRRWPHFSAAALAVSLPAAGIDYVGCRSWEDAENPGLFPLGQPSRSEQ